MRIDIAINGVFWERFTGLSSPSSAHLLGWPSIFYFLKNILLEFSSRFNTTISSTCKRSSFCTEEMNMMRKKLYFLLSVFSKYFLSRFSSYILKSPLLVVNSIVLKETIHSTLVSAEFLCYLWNRVTLYEQYSYFMKFSFVNLCFSFDHTTNV